jgi:hypothetical protein
MDEGKKPLDNIFKLNAKGKKGLPPRGNTMVV